MIKIAERTLTPSEALKEINLNAFISYRKPMKMDKFRKIIVNPYYAGVVEMDRKVKWRNEVGAHDPLITIEQHKKIVEIDSGHKKNQNGPKKNGNPDYPLSNLVTCAKCKDAKYCRLVGFDHTNGTKNGITYYKYRCRECGMYVSKDYLHKDTIEMINTCSLNEQTRETFVRALKIVWNKQLANQKIETTRLKNRKNQLEIQIDQQAIEAIKPDNIILKKSILKMSKS